MFISTVIELKTETTLKMKYSRNKGFSTNHICKKTNFENKIR